MTAADLTTSFAYLRNYIGRDDWVRPEGQKCEHCEALDHLDRIEQTTLTPEEARWLLNMLVTEGYIGTMPDDGDGPMVAKLERIAGNAEEVTPQTNHA